MTRPATPAVRPATAGLGDAVLAVLLIGLLTALRVALLFATDLDLYGDEAQYWTYGQELAFGYYSKPPVIAVLTRLTGSLGDGAAWVRLASPLLHGATALALFALARAIYGARTALLASLAYATLPAASYAALLISTDTPLLLFWVLALLALHRLADGGRGRWAIVLGLAFGLGMLSKYAMAYLLLGLAVWAVLSGDGRRLLQRRHLWYGLALGLLVFAPNLWWNLQHGGASIVHVAENASAGGNVWQPDEGIAFFFAQFGVAGPVFFAVLLLRLVLALRWPLGHDERFLLAFSVPILTLIQVQAFMAGAHANWAATAVPAVTVLGVGWLAAAGRRLWLGVAYAVNAAALLGLALAALQPQLVTAAGGPDALEELTGWRSFAREVDRRAAACDCPVVLFNDRFELAQAWYYGRIDPARLEIWTYGRLGHHYAMTRPYSPPDRGHVLYVAREAKLTPPADRLGTVVSRDTFVSNGGPGAGRRYHAYVIDPS